MTTPHDWGQYTTGTGFKFATPGDTIAGTLCEIRSHTFEAKGTPGEKDYRGPNTVPILIIDAGGPARQEVTCSNVDLIEQLKRTKPAVGQRVEIEYLRDIPTNSGGSKKIFGVKVTGDPRPVPAEPSGYTKEPPF